jgi:pristinamycin I synthase 3 and 4
LKNMLHQAGLVAITLLPAAAPLNTQYTYIFMNGGRLVGYVLWKHATRGDEGNNQNGIERQLSFWTDALKDLPEEIGLPYDRPRPAVPSNRSASVAIEFSEKLHRGLLALANVSGASLFMVLQAGLAALLSRLGGGRDIPIGSPIAGRTGSEPRDLVGPFVNALVLRTDVSGKPSFTELLGRVRKGNLAAYDHSEIPFERLDEILKSARSSSRHPLFQVMLALNDCAEDSIGLSDAACANEPVAGLNTQLDLCIGLCQRRGPDGSAAGIGGRLKYATDLFNRDTAEAIVQRLVRLFEAAVADPGQPIGRLDILSLTERHKILYEWNDTKHVVTSATLSELFEEQVAKTPDVAAAVFEDTALGYSELNARANQLAHFLRKRGVGPETVVGLCVDRSQEMLVGLIGILKAGGAYLPLDPAHPTKRLAYMLDDAGATVLVTQQGLLKRLSGALPRNMAKQQICLDTDWPAIALRPTSTPDSALNPDHPAYVIYTSGSTGTPKGVVMPHRALVNLVSWNREAIRGEPGSAVAQLTPLSFDVSAQEIFSALTSGRTLFIPANDLRRDPAELVDWIAAHKIKELYAPNLVIDSLCEAIAERGGSPTTLAHVTQAGEALTHNDKFRTAFTSGARLHNHYGPTETHVATSYDLPIATSEWPSCVPIGRPIWNTQVYILDEGLEPVPIGISGELYIAGAGLARGYLNRPDLTAERFVDNPFGAPGSRMYRTGDLARWRSDGMLEFLGRVDTQVKLRGFRIELGEIESAFLRQPDVSQAAVTTQDHDSSGPRLVGYVVASPGAVVSTSSLRAALLAELPDYMVPAAIVVLDRLPLTLNGKLDRRALPAATASDLPHAANGEPPRDKLERALVGIFSDVLGTKVTTREADFFHLGGHSLLALRVMRECKTRLGLDLSRRGIHEHPRIADLSDFLRTKSRPASEMTRVPRLDAQALTPQQYAIWLELKLNPDAGTYNEPVAFRAALNLNPQKIRRALERLAATHEILRARLVEQEGEPCFVLDRSIKAIEFEVLDDDRWDLQAVLRRPFDLTRGPLWRATLRHEPGGSTVLLLVVHHIVLDAASEEILLRDLAAAYDDPGGVLSPGDYEFFDIASHERAQLAVEKPASERFWAETLQGADLTPKLPPPCVPCAPDEEKRGCVTRRTLGPALTRSIRSRAAELGTTPFHFYFAAYLTLLRTYTASDDLVVGSPFSLRETSASQNVVGYLLNPLPLRVRLAGSLSFREAVVEVSRRWQKSSAHGRLPMSLLLKSTPGELRSGLGSPFQIFFSLVNDLKAGLSINGKPLLSVEVAPRSVKFQLFLLVEEQAGDASLVLEYQRGVLDPAMAERLLAHLEQLLRTAIVQVDTPLSQMTLLDPQEREQLRTFGICERPYARDSTIPDLFEDVARRYGDKPALIAGDVELSYSALDRRANSVAAELRRAGVGRGDRVPLMLDRGLRFIASALGVLKCGAAFVPLDSTYPPERLARMLEGLDAHVGLCAAQPELPATEIRWLDAGCADEESASAAPFRRCDATDAAYVMFTSGSTGRPKAVEVPHRAIIRLVQSQDFARMGSQENWLHISPTSFDASTLEIWAPLLNGGRSVILEKSLPTPDLLAETIRRHGITSAWFTSAFFNTLIDLVPEALQGLQQILVGGEALSPDHMRRAFEQLPGVRFVNGYGPTENTTFTCCHAINKSDVYSGQAIPIGRPVANTSVFILDGDGRLAPLGIPGELVAGGDGVALGYVCQPADTTERFLADTLSGRSGGRIYRTGDRARWRPDGVIEFLGRFDDQVKIRGFRVEPGEVAACLAESPDVRQAVVVPRRAASGATQLVAYVVAQRSMPGPELIQRLASHAAERLPAYMRPTDVVLVPQLPLNENGKIDIRALDSVPRGVAQAGQEVEATPLEAKLLRIWCDVLNNPTLGPDDDFFAAGGDSLLALRTITRAEQELEIAIPIRALVEGRSVRGFASLLAKLERPVLPQGMVRIRQGNVERPLFWLPGLGGGGLQMVGLAERLSSQRAVYAVELHNLDVEQAVFESLSKTAVAVAERVRGAQPEGPYSLLGFSFGGNLVIEVARLLLREGQQVELVVLLDAYAPGSIRKAAGIRKVLRFLWVLPRMRLREARDYVASLILRRLGFTVPETERPVFQSELERPDLRLVELAGGAIYSYQHDPIDQRVVLVQATNHDDREYAEIVDSSDTNGWNAICRPGVDVIRVDCTHGQLLTEPYISELAQRLDVLVAGDPLLGR